MDDTLFFNNCPHSCNSALSHPNRISKILSSLPHKHHDVWLRPVALMLVRVDEGPMTVALAGRYSLHTKLVPSLWELVSSNG